VGCDQDAPQPPSPAANVHLLASNVGTSQSLPANGAIQLAFDRLLLPSCITRQTFILQGLTPTVAYDPVARVVTVTPTTSLTPGQSYELDLATPANAADPSGVRAVDGAILAPGSTDRLVFLATAATATSGPTPPPTIDFCNDIFAPVFQTCGGPGCHGTALPAAGLLLATTEGVAQTAIGRVAHGANTGPNAATQPPGLLFGEDMPIIDPGSGAGAAGNPGDSWLLYKLLMAVPEAGVDPSCDGGATGGGDAGDLSEAAAPGDAHAVVDATVAGDATVPGEAAAAPDDAESDAVAAREGGGAPEDAGAAEDAGEEAAAAATTPAPLASVCGLYSVPWQPISSTERAALSNLIPGREMPYPASLDAGVGTGVSVDTLERISLWIAQGATVENCSQ
jgi:hypothetical protein